VGDTTGDMIESRHAGVKAIGAAWGWHGRVRLSTAAPFAIVDTPSELAAFFSSMQE
jgi:phosphoglycolate phosphatase-like HAD superfamily hydrolase